MARKVKCFITKEEGTSDIFIKIDNKYYKSQEIYDESQKAKESFKKLIKYIGEELLGYETGQVYPSLVFKKLTEYKFYDNEVILKTFKLKEKDILYQINQDNKFKNDNGKVFYMFAIVKNAINDVHKEWLKEQKQITLNNKQDMKPIEILESVKHDNKNIKNWLGDDDL